LPALRESVAGFAAPPKAVAEILSGWDDIATSATLLARALVDSPPPLVTEGGMFRPGYHPDLDELMELTEHGEGRLRDLLRQEQEDGNLPKLKLGYNRVFGYYFELSRAAGYPRPISSAARPWPIANATSPRPTRSLRKSCWPPAKNARPSNTICSSNCASAWRPCATGSWK
jgi:hypothetical protein